MLVCAIVAILMAAGLSGACHPAKDSGAPGLASEEGQGRDPEAAGGYVLSEEIRLTNDTADDGFPALAVDSYGNSQVLWNRSGTQMRVKIDRQGLQLFNETEVVTAPLPVQHTGQVNERAGVDGQDDFHVLWATRGLYGPWYQIFNPYGDALTQPMNLSPMANCPHAFSMAVGTNDRAYFAYENEVSERIEMAFIDSSLNLHTGYLSTTRGEGVTIGLDRRDCPYVFHRDAISGALSFTKFSPDGQLMASPTRVSATTPGPGMPMPALAFGADGAVHLLEPSSTGGPRALYYTKLGSDGVRLAGDIPITSDAGDGGDLCVDSQGNVFIVWGSSSDQELYYVRIRPGQENDSVSPVRLTRAFGADQNPQVAVDSADMVHLVWQSDRDGNGEIYYRSAYLFGVGAGMTDDERIKLLLVRPNETRTANLTIDNTGNFNGTFRLCVKSDFQGHDGWKVDVNETRLKIEGRGFRNVTVRVTGPPAGLDGDYIDAGIIASPDCDPGDNRTIAVRSSLTAHYDFTLNCSDPNRTIEAGGNALYTLQVENTGDLDNEIELAPDGTAGWEWALSQGTVRLGPGQSRNVTLAIRAPEDASGGDRGIFFITGQSVPDSGACARISVRAEVLLRGHLEISADQQEIYVAKEEIAVYTITVRSHGNLGRLLVVDLEAEYGLTDWQVVLDPAQLAVPSGEGAFARLLVIPTVSAGPGSSLAVKVVCSDAERRWSANCTTVTRFRAPHGMEVEFSPSSAAVDPGGFSAFRVNLTNLGKDADGVIPGIFSAPAGLVISYRSLDGKVLEDCQAVPVKRNGIAAFDIIIAATPGAPAGNNTITGYVVDGGGNRYPVEMRVRVNQVHDVALLSSYPEQTGAAGRTVVFPVRVLNHGNGPDVLRFNATGLPEGWPPPRFCDAGGRALDRIGLDVSEMRRLTVQVQVPAAVPQDTIEFCMIATLGNGANATVRFLMALDKPDLVVSGIELFGQLRPHRPVMVKVSVENRGDAGAENVTLAYYLNRTLRSTRSFGTLAVGETRAVWMEWMPEAGDNILEFVADPGGNVSERNENNNAAMLIQSVQGAVPSDRPDVPILIYVVAVMALSALLAAAAWFRWRPRKA